MAQNPAPGQMVDAGGFKMHIHCTGEGSPTVILVSGLDDFSIMWSLVQPEIAKTTRVCSYDRAGLGWSETSPSPRTSTNMAKELHTLLVGANVEDPYAMVGHSFGGALARLYVHNYPDEVVGLVLVDAAPPELFERFPAWSTAIETKMKMFRVLEPLSSFGLFALSPNSIPNRGLPDDALTQYRAISVATDYYKNTIVENEMFVKNLVEINAADTSFGDLPLIVLSRGLFDPMPGLTDKENQQARQAWSEMQAGMLKLSSNSKQIIAEKSEHFIQLQQPQLVIDAVMNILNVTRK
jgi:pimeloyl-ACP methyl ester carboxylesterase